MKTKNRIKEFRQKGFKIEVNHCRKWEPFFCAGSLTKYEVIKRLQPMNNGGMTVLNVTTPDGKNFTNYAICSEKDCYNRAAGIALAWKRLEEQGCFAE